MSLFRVRSIFFKGNIKQNYFIGKYSYHIDIDRYLKKGILDFIFVFRGAIDPAETDFEDFRSEAGAGIFNKVEPIPNKNQVAPQHWLIPR
jgi:hypothetical protein